MSENTTPYVKVIPTAAGQMGISIPHPTIAGKFVFEVKSVAEVLTILGIPDLISSLSLDDMIPILTEAEFTAQAANPNGYGMIRIIDTGGSASIRTWNSITSTWG